MMSVSYIKALFLLRLYEVETFYGFELNIKAGTLVGLSEKKVIERTGNFRKCIVKENSDNIYSIYNVSEWKVNQEKLLKEIEKCLKNEFQEIQKTCLIGEDFLIKRKQEKNY